MNATYTALIALMRSGEISLESGESVPAFSSQFSVRIRPESRVFLDRCANIWVSPVQPCLACASMVLLLRPGTALPTELPHFMNDSVC